MVSSLGFELLGGDPAEGVVADSTAQSNGQATAVGSLGFSLSVQAAAHGQATGSGSSSVARHAVAASHGVAAVSSSLSTPTPQGASHGAATGAGSLAVAKHSVTAAHGTAAASGSLLVAAPSIHVEADGHGTATGSLGAAKGAQAASAGTATVVGSMGSQSLSIQGYVGIRTVGETLNITGRVAKSNTEPRLPNIDDGSGVGLLTTRHLLPTYWT